MLPTENAMRLRQMANYETAIAQSYAETVPDLSDWHQSRAAALLAGAAALEAITPQRISEKHKQGHWWQVWEPLCERWVKGRWRERSQMWIRPDDGYVVAPTHALPVPPAPEGE